MLPPTLAGPPYLRGPVQMLVHDRPLVHRDDGFRGWNAVVQSTMWSLRVVVLSPLLDDDLRLLQSAEDFPVQQFVSEAGVKALAISVFLR